MSQMTPIANRSPKTASLSLWDKPRRSDDIVFRRDGEDDQIIVLSKEDLALPLILNPTAARIFLLCDGENRLRDIAKALSDEFGLDDFDTLLEDVKLQVGYFLDKEIVTI